MTRLAWNGAETQLVGAASATDPEGDLWITNTATINTANPRSGAACYSCAASATSHARRLTVGGVTVRNYFCRAYLRFTSVTPSSSLVVLSPFNVSQLASINLETNGTLILKDLAGTQIGSASAALSANTWYRVEMQINTPAAGNGMLGFWLDGKEIVAPVALNANVGAQPISELRAGHTTSGETAVTVLVDDLAINDDQGASQNSLPGEGKIVISKPISDNALGTGWEGPQTTGSDTTDLFDNVNNTPPLGVAHADTDANALKYVFNIASNAATNFDVNCQSYITAGLPADAQVRLVQAIVRTGSSSATDTAGALALVSNPSQGAETSFAAFDSGIAGTEPTNWKTARGTLVYDPALDTAASPVLRVGKRTANVLVAMVDLMGIMIEYQPGLPDVVMAPMEAA